MVLSVVVLLLLLVRARGAATTWMLIPGFCTAGDHTPLHNLALAAAQRGHHVRVGLPERCLAQWRVPRALSARLTRLVRL